MIVEIGYSLLAVGTTGGLPLHFALLMPRALGFGVLSLALSAIRARTGGLDIQPGARSRAAHANRRSRGGGGIIHSGWFPLAGGFPVHLALWETVGKQFLWAAVWSVLGSAGLMAAGLRSLGVLLASPEDTPWQVSETRLEACPADCGDDRIIGGRAFSRSSISRLSPVWLRVLSISFRRPYRPVGLQARRPDGP